jgi:hypothetical protein
VFEWGQKTLTSTKIVQSPEKLPEVREIFGEKVPVPGNGPNEYVLDHTRCVRLIQHLPSKRAAAARKLIADTFTRVRAGDQSLHAEIDARATSNDAEAEMARSALSINRDEQLQSLERKRKLEELNIEMSDMALSKQKLEPPPKKLTCLFTLRQTVIQYPVDPKRLLFSLSPVCDCFEWPSDVPQQNDHCW